MKSWVIMVGAAVTGIAVGTGMTAVEMTNSRALFLPEDFATRAAEKKVVEQVERSRPRPQIEVVGEDEYDFGSMERYSTRRHTFRVRNVGQAPLSLRKGRTTCKCTLFEIDRTTCGPGDEAAILVEWTGQTVTGEPEFGQSVDIHTNDLDHEVLTLFIKGYVTETVRALPEELIVGRVSADTGAEVDFRLFGFRGEKIDILESAFENAETADRFELQLEPLPADQVAKEKGASCGLLGRLTVKPGLPLGPINQTIRLRARVDKEATIHVPVRGRVISDILVASSREFEANNGLLRFGALKRGESRKAVLQVFVKGEHRQDIVLTVGAVEPEGYLKVDIGPPEELNQGKTIRYFVTVAIPPGLDAINRLGSADAGYGRIVLETTHPQTKQIPIWVKFAVD